MRLASSKSDRRTRRDHRPPPTIWQKFWIASCVGRSGCSGCFVISLSFVNFVCSVCAEGASALAADLLSRSPGASRSSRREDSEISQESEDPVALSRTTTTVLGRRALCDRWASLSVGTLSGPGVLREDAIVLRCTKCVAEA